MTLVIVTRLKVCGRDEDERTFRANTPLLLVGLAGNLAILGFPIYDDPSSLIWCAGLIAVGVVLFLIEYTLGSRNRPRAPGAAIRRPSPGRVPDMHVVVATDGSPQSLAAARRLHSFADPRKITGIPVGAVIRPLASVAFADGISEAERRRAGEWTGSFREAAQNAVDAVAAVFDGWGPTVGKEIRSGSPAAEIIEAAEQHDAGLVVVAAGGRVVSDAILIGSTAQRVQHYAPCAVLVVRPAPRARRTAQP